MGRQKWTNMKAMEPYIEELRAKGKARREIAEALGLNFVQIKNWVNRRNKEQQRLSAGLPTKQQGRPRKGEIKSEADYQYEMNRLKMENKLLRDFLQSTERK